MSNNMMIEKKQGLMNKILNFFKNIFFKKIKKEPNTNNTAIELIDDNKNNIEKMSKKDFFELYEKVKNNEVDLLSLDRDTLEKIYKLIQEEIKIVEKDNLKVEREIKEIKDILNN